jgi:hypothetical protein
MTQDKTTQLLSAKLSTWKQESNRISSSICRHAREICHRPWVFLVGRSM